MCVKSYLKGPELYTLFLPQGDRPWHPCFWPYIIGVWPTISLSVVVEAMKAPHLLWEQISLAAPVVFVDQEAVHGKVTVPPAGSSSPVALRLLMAPGSLSDNSGVWGSFSALSCVRRIF